MKHYRVIIEIEVDEKDESLETYHPKGTLITQVLTDEINSWMLGLGYVRDVPYVDVSEEE